MLTFSFTVIWGCSRTHCANTVGTLTLSSCTAFGLHSAHPTWSMWTSSHTLNAESRHFDRVMVSFEIQRAGILSQNDSEHVPVQIMTGCAVCAQTCLHPGEAEEGGSDACMNKGCVREDWLSTLNTWQIVYLVSQPSYNRFFTLAHLQTILKDTVSVLLAFMKWSIYI